MKGVIFFDIDNTLVKTDEFQNYILNESFSEVINAGIGVTKKQLQETYDKQYKNNKNSPKHYDLTFDELKIPKEKIPYYVSIILKKREEIKKEYSKFAMENVKKVIEKLSKEYILGIVSHGTKESQMEKLRMLDLLKFFPENNIWITNDEFKKNNEFFKRLKRLFEKKGIKNIWMVGDREDQDIIPAMQCGIKAIRMYYGKYSELALDQHKNKIIFKLEEIFDHLIGEEMRI